MINSAQTYIRHKFPRGYYLGFGLASIFLNLIKFKTLILNGKQAHWALQTRKGEQYLYTYWSPFNSVTHPLRIPFEFSYEIEFPLMNLSDDLDIRNFNPSIAFNDQGLRICWRMSNIRFDPRTNKKGESLFKINLGNSNGIAVGLISRNDVYTNGKIEEPSILIHPSPQQRNHDHMIEVSKGEFLDFEDPRFLSVNPDILLLHGRHKSVATKFMPRNFDVVLYDIKTNKFEILEIENRNRTEKNWIPVRETLEYFELLRSTDPYSFVKIRKSNFSVEVFGETIEKFGNIHNGSNFLLIDESYYIRVVRNTISIEGLRGVRINQIILHDLEMREIGRTKPFLLKDFGYEICNSIASDANYIFFAWGFNDLTGYLGYIKKSILITWIYDNLFTN